MLYKRVEYPGGSAPAVLLYMRNRMHRTCPLMSRLKWSVQLPYVYCLSSRIVTPQWRCQRSVRLVTLIVR